MSRRRAVSLNPRVGAKKAKTFNGLQEPGHAVPTGEAHRLPKSVAYLSARVREVKTVTEEKCDGASTCSVVANGDAKPLLADAV
jgi:hypothetical protein